MRAYHPHIRSPVEEPSIVFGTLFVICVVMPIFAVAFVLLLANWQVRRRAGSGLPAGPMADPAPDGELECEAPAVVGALVFIKKSWPGSRARPRPRALAPSGALGRLLLVLPFDQVTACGCRPAALSVPVIAPIVALLAASSCHVGPLQVVRTLMAALSRGANPPWCGLPARRPRPRKLPLFGLPVFLAVLRRCGSRAFPFFIENSLLMLGYRVPPRSTEESSISAVFLLLSRT